MEVAKPNYDRTSELKAFDETKEGVKGLVDAKFTQIPRIFHHPPHLLDSISLSSDPDHTIPVIDLLGLDHDPSKRKELVEQVRIASESWGFFQVINHGIPATVLEEMKDGVRRFYEQDTQVKKEYYTRDLTRPFVYNTNFDLFTGPAANWRDTFFCPMAPDPPKMEDLPVVCR